MHNLIHHLYLILANLGAGGLFLLGVLDSSFLMMPLGNDLLIVGLTVSHHDRLWYYVPVASFGSAAGVLFMDVVVRRGGEEGLKKWMKPQRFEYLKRKIAERAAVALSLASLAPPPFPFTPVIAAACAFGYTRWKLLTTIFVTRVIRFTIIGLLAIRFGRHILTLAKTPAFEWSMAVFIALCAVASGVSVYGWIRRSRRLG